MRGIGRRIRGEEEAAKFLARPQNLAPARPAPAVVSGGEVEQLERAIERIIEPIRSAGVVRTNRSLDLAADVGELLDEGERRPARGEGLVGVCGLRHASPSSRVSSLAASSARDRVANDMNGDEDGDGFIVRTR